jgi:hypothetical protein
MTAKYCVCGRRVDGLLLWVIWDNTTIKNPYWNYETKTWGKAPHWTPNLEVLLVDFARHNPDDIPVDPEFSLVFTGSSLKPWIL